MITKDQILQATGAELSRLAGEVLPLGKCTSCLVQSFYDEEVEPKTCPKKNLPLTPDNAFKWRDWAVDKYGQLAFSNAVTKVYWDTEYAGSDIEVNGYKWVIAKAQPEHYIKAACLCKIESK